MNTKTSSLCPACGGELVPAMVYTDAARSRRAGFECHHCWAVYTGQMERVSSILPKQPEFTVAASSIEPVLTVPKERMQTAPIIERLPNEDGSAGPYAWTQFGLKVLERYKELRRSTEDRGICLELALRHGYKFFGVPRERDRARQQMKESTIKHLELVTSLFESEDATGKDIDNRLVEGEALAKLISRARKVKPT